MFFHDVRVPADALLGPLNAGWQVATTTLSHERAGAARLYAEMQVRLEELVDDIAAHSADALEDPGDPAASRRNRAPHQVSRGAVPAVDLGDPAWRWNAAFGSASLAKTVWGEIGQDLAALAFDVLGTRGTDAPWANYRLTSRSLTIAGGTSQINKNITAQRVLGLPRK